MDHQIPSENKTQTLLFFHRSLHKQKGDLKCGHTFCASLSGFNAKTLNAWRSREMKNCTSADLRLIKPTTPTWLHYTSHACVLWLLSDLTWVGWKLLQACPSCVSLVHALFSFHVLLHRTTGVKCQQEWSFHWGGNWTDAWWAELWLCLKPEKNTCSGGAIYLS